jgi:hypothetical protein
MESFIFVTVLSFAVLIPPSLAQQANTGSSAQPAAHGEPAAGMPPSVGATRGGSEQLTSNDFWDGEEPSLGNLMLHPFATKRYVQRQLELIQRRVSELDELTDSNSRIIKEVDFRAQQGIQRASATARKLMSMQLYVIRPPAGYRDSPATVLPNDQPAQNRRNAAAIPRSKHQFSHRKVRRSAGLQFLGSDDELPNESTRCESHMRPHSAACIADRFSAQVGLYSTT